MKTGYHFVAASALLLFAFSTNTLAQDSPDGVWLSVSEFELSAAQNSSTTTVQPDVYRAARLNEASLQTALETAPQEQVGIPAEQTPGSILLYLPTPDGQYMAFYVVDSPIMSPELAEKFPEIKTYAGSSVDNHAVTVRLDVTPAGLHAQVLDIGKRWYIDPYGEDNPDLYMSYSREDLTSGDAQQCRVPGDNRTAELSSPAMTVSGNEVRTYRLAVATTGEYGQFHGGTLLGAMSAVSTTINRVTGIFEREVAIRFELIGNNDNIVFVNAGTDPFTGNGDSDILIDESQTVINANIGAANYDVGHTFSTGAGGLAAAGICVDDVKARGVTGGPNPIGDAYDVDFVSHEIGHQFAASHTFNGTQGNCGGTTRNGPTAFEIGSGSTIMGYAGICDNDDLQTNSDVLFHSASHEQIITGVTIGDASTCGAVEPLGNTIPTANAGLNYTIPLNTPFVLTGSGADADATDVLTYTWEERDLGPAATLQAPDDGLIPLQRVFAPLAAPSRFIPRLTTLAANVADPAQKLPLLPRVMNWRMTVRDGKGGVQSAASQITVATGTGPFTVTFPNGGESLSGALPVTWSTANTDVAPVNTPFVDIFLSTDGGLTFDLSDPLVSNTPNDGLHSVTFPNTTSTTARLMVKGHDNVFFDISDQNFTITSSDPVGKVIPNDSWRLISLPAIPPAGANTVADLFGDDITGAYGVTWKMWGYDTTINDYVDPLVTGTLSPGKAYWIKQITGAAVTLDMPAGSTPTPVTPGTSCSDTPGCFPIALAATNDVQWNMVGNPFYTTPAIDNMRVTTNSGSCSDADGCTLTEAEQTGANVMNNVFYTWNGGPTYVAVLPGATWNVWTGYWSRVLPGAESLSPVLLVPRDADL